MIGPIYKSPHAKEIPYDNEGTGILADNVQDAIDAMAGTGATDLMFSSIAVICGTDAVMVSYDQIIDSSGNSLVKEVC